MVVYFRSIVPARSVESRRFDVSGDYGAEPSACWIHILRGYMMGIEFEFILVTTELRLDSDAVLQLYCSMKDHLYA